MTDKESKTIKEADGNDYRRAFLGEFGERVLKDLSKYCCENRICYQPGDPYHTTYNEGARSVILYIRTKLEEECGDRQTEVIQENE